MRQPQSLLNPSSSDGAGQLRLQTRRWPDGSDRTVLRFPDGVGILADDLPLAFATYHLHDGRAQSIEEAMAMVPGLHHYEEIADLGLAATATTPPPNAPPPFTPWAKCVAALDDAALRDFAAWRGFSWEFCVHLRAERLVGLYHNRSGTPFFCYPVHSPGGQVIAEQVFTQSTTGAKSFYTEGASGNLSPVVLGPLPHAHSIFGGESPHDVYGFADKSGYWRDPDASFIATRGASNSRLLSNLPWPQSSNGQTPPTLVLLCQNDNAIGPDGLTGNERWVKQVRPALPFSYYLWFPPSGIKDFNDWTRAGVTEQQLVDELYQLKTTKPIDPAPSLIELLTPSEIKAYQPPPGILLVGDNHIVRGNAFVIAGAPGVGKSRATVALAEAGATGCEWFGLKIHCRFSTIIIQNENGRYRLKQEFANLDVALLDKYLRITPPPPQGLCFHKDEFRDQLKRLFDTFPPAVVILDPWNAVSPDDKQADYLESFELVQATLPSGDQAPALGIVPHTRKPRPDERSNRGRALLNLIAGSYVLTSVPRTAWVLQSASDSVTETRVVVTCAKNNDGQLGDRSTWQRDNGLWTEVTGFNWSAFDNPSRPGKGNSGSSIDENTVGSVFDFGYKALKASEAVAELIKLTGLSRAQCYRAIKLDGPHKNHLHFDPKTKLITWIP